MRAKCPKFCHSLYNFYTHFTTFSDLLFCSRYVRNMNIDYTYKNKADMAANSAFQYKVVNIKIHYRDLIFFLLKFYTNYLWQIFWDFRDTKLINHITSVFIV